MHFLCPIYIYINNNTAVKIASLIPLAYINSLLTLLTALRKNLDNKIPHGIPIIIDIIHCVKVCTNQIREISLYWKPKLLNIDKFLFWSNKLYEFIFIIIIYPIIIVNIIIIIAGVVYESNAFLL